MDGELLEIILAATIIIMALNLFLFHILSMNRLIENERESIKITHLYLLSDRVVSSVSYPVYGIVDCTKIECNGFYVRCGNVRCGTPKGIRVKRFVQEGNKVVILEVGE